ncbi:transposase [Nitrosomonas europaea]|jgi:transposase|nr:transposase [Nitrosomonas europaea]KXK46392.1 MAG: hypothetical protein UZ02_AOB001000794 [Nitrosomonas europaea]SDW93049.1 Putative transposase of IS4/5 family [Nitrosomonas europaea]SET46411.1 Putative transposase of IS4/5 family [Nitrosomonas europaea]SKA02734.1 Putative transposase of IS4/5 family [Nitrosomonas europaea]
MAKTTSVASREVSDALWERMELLILAAAPRRSDRIYMHKPGGGRKPKDPRLVFEAIVYVLRTGCQRKALPRMAGLRRIRSVMGRLVWPNTTTWRALSGADKASTAP